MRKSGELLKKVSGDQEEYFKREWVIYFLLAVTAIIIVVKLFGLQVVQAADLKAKGTERRTVDQSLLPKRGSIYDAQGHVLAQSVPAKEVYIDPRTLDNYIANGRSSYSKEEYAKQIATVLELDVEIIWQKLNQDTSWVSLAHQVDIDKADQLTALEIPGLGMNDEQKRVYPMGELAASTLGIVNLAGHGVEGIEGYYDDELFGKPGFASQEQDSGRGSIMDTLHQNDPAQAGNNLTLTLDSTIQYLVEQQLDQIQESTSAEKITILAMDPMTGKILGMGSRPTYDPNQYYSTSPEQRRNLSISMAYEPGSTFKIITGAAALEEGTVTPDTMFHDPGFLEIGSRVITNWDSEEKIRGDLTFQEGMQVSSNVVLAQVGTKLGMEDFYTYLRAFGFGSKTGIDIMGEEAGLILPEDQARPIDLATMSFGQTNLVTPIQLLNALNAVANGGTLYQPYVVDQITSPAGEVVKQNEPTVKRQVISETTAQQMSDILVGVVDSGTGHLAKIPGVEVAGKTGTAQKVDPETGEYSKTDYIASFAAYAPADDPKISVLIVIDTPQGESHQGGVLAAPSAKAIIEGALNYYGIPVEANVHSDVPDSIDNSSVRSEPQPVIPERIPVNGEVVVPDVKGLTMREAGNYLNKSDLKFNFSGTGLAYRQDPAPGQVVPEGSRVQVEFSPTASYP